jgi:hypothetical protein
MPESDKMAESERGLKGRGIQKGASSLRQMVDPDLSIWIGTKSYRQFEFIHHRFQNSGTNRMITV